MTVSQAIRVTRCVAASGLALCIIACSHSNSSQQSRYERKAQEEAVATIHALGGHVRYDYERPDPAEWNCFDPNARPRNPEAFHKVVLVTLRDTEITDDDLRLLRNLPNTEILDLTNTSVTGAGFVNLRSLENLQSLGLWKTQVHDNSLEHLRNFTTLRQLTLDETHVTDEGLTHLAALTNLEDWLGLTDTFVTDRGLDHLAGLTKLRHINLRRTFVTEKGVRELRAALPETDISFGL